MSQTLTIEVDSTGSPKFVYEMDGWRFERSYQHHKVLRDASKHNTVTEHAFMVELTQGNDKLPGYGPTYEVWVFEVGRRPRAIRHQFTDRKNLSNWTFAHRLFTQLFGCGYDASIEVNATMYETSVFTPVTPADSLVRTR
jgi:hypothetical protein